MPHGACALSFGVSRYQMVLVVPDSALHHRAQTRRPWTRNTHHCSACESTKSESKSKPPSSLPRASARRRGHRPTPTWRLGHRPPWRSPCPGRVSPRPRIALLMAAGFPPPSLHLASPQAIRHSRSGDGGSTRAREQQALFAACVHAACAIGRGLAVRAGAAVATAIDERGYRAPSVSGAGRCRRGGSCIRKRLAGSNRRATGVRQRVVYDKSVRHDTKIGELHRGIGGVGSSWCAYWSE